jgi:hypothetical protein
MGPLSSEVAPLGVPRQSARICNFPVWFPVTHQEI